MYLLEEIQSLLGKCAALIEARAAHPISVILPIAKELVFGRITRKLPNG